MILEVIQTIKKKQSIDNYYLTDYSKPTISQKAKLNGKELTIKVNKGQQKGEDPITLQGNNYYLKGDSTLVKTILFHILLNN